MNASEFAKKRAAINRRAKGREAFARKALGHLIREARAVPLAAGGKTFGYRLPDGTVACVKQRYRDQQSAVLELLHIAKHASNGNIPVRSYECNSCGGFHLTSKK